jgi:hypothetical protein
MNALSERAEFLADEIAPELRISRGAAESRIALPGNDRREAWAAADQSGE